MKRVLCIAIALLFCSACKKSVEGEAKRYRANKDRLNELIALYPGFEKPLQARLDKGEKIFDEAKGMSDKEAGAERMGDAIEAVTSGFISDLDDIEDKLNEVKDKAVEAATSATDAATASGAKLAAEQANKTIAAVEAALKAGATDESKAKAIVGKALRDLEAAEKTLGKVTAAAAGKKAAEESKTKEAAAEKAAEKAEKADWKCEYCTAANPHTDHKCKSCGAARAKKAAPAPK